MTLNLKYCFCLLLVGPRGGNPESGNTGELTFEAKDELFPEWGPEDELDSDLCDLLRNEEVLVRCTIRLDDRTGWAISVVVALVKVKVIYLVSSSILQIEICRRLGERFYMQFFCQALAGDGPAQPIPPQKHHGLTFGRDSWYSVAVIAHSWRMKVGGVFSYRSE